MVPTALHSAVTNDGNHALAGFVRNGGQWPDSILALYQSEGTDVWFTRTGVVRDVYSVSKGWRVGNVSYTDFQGAVISIVKNDNGAIPVTFITGRSTQGIPTFASCNDQVLLESANGHVERYSISNVGHLVRDRPQGSGNEASERADESRGMKCSEVVQGKKSSVFTSGTFIGGPGTDEIAALITLPDGSILVAGSTTQTIFPENLGGYSRIHGGNYDGFLARIDASFSKVYSWTFIGGTGVDKIKAVALDRFRNVCIVSQTDSYDMPVLLPGEDHKVIWRKGGTHRCARLVDDEGHHGGIPWRAERRRPLLHRR